MEYGTIAKLMAGRQFYFIAYNGLQIGDVAEIEAENYLQGRNLI